MLGATAAAGRPVLGYRVGQLGEQLGTTLENSLQRQEEFFGKVTQLVGPHEQLGALKDKLAEVTMMLEPLENLGHSQRKPDRLQKTPEGSEAADSQVGTLYEQAWDHGW